MRLLYDENPDTRLAKATRRIARLEKRPLALGWETPDLLNGWTQAGDPWDLHQYRRHMDGSLEMHGHLRATGASLSIAYVVKGALAGEGDYRPLKDDSWLEDIVVSPGGFTIARFRVYGHSSGALAGNVTIEYPATGIA
jgi:hypothetical protein